MTSQPLVSFVVPCYRLGHLIRECLESILAQSYAHIEVLVMDDCSPDHTSEVVSSIHDARLVYIRNEHNLGHLRNYNKGIDLARGKYVWLISADDVLRSSAVLERFVEVLERNPTVGYVFCPAIRFTADADLGVYGSHGPTDRIFEGQQFLRRWLVRGNSVPAAAGLVRKACYRHVGSFPLDMPFAGDWYMWSVFALHADVAYLAEPMVGYRSHDANMTHDFKRRPKALIADNFRVLWRMKKAAEDHGLRSLAQAYLRALAVEYAYTVAPPNRDATWTSMTVDEVGESLAEHSRDRRESAFIKGAVFAALGDREYDARNLPAARACYRAALALTPLSMRTMAKNLLAQCGGPGRRVRDALTAWKRWAATGAVLFAREVKVHGSQPAR
jgi:glycosyltransferase involved in cell wall biosynthesis